MVTGVEARCEHGVFSLIILHLAFLRHCFQLNLELTDPAMLQGSSLLPLQGQGYRLPVSLNTEVLGICIQVPMLPWQALH